MTQTEALKLADRLLDFASEVSADFDTTTLEKASDELRRLDSALAQTEQEPLAWDGDCVLGHCGSPAGCEASNCCRADYTTPYVATPRPQRTWVGLTEDETAELVHRYAFYELTRQIEAKLKEKNTSNGGCV